MSVLPIITSWPVSQIVVVVGLCTATACAGRVTMTPNCQTVHARLLRNQVPEACGPEQGQRSRLRSGLLNVELDVPVRFRFKIGRDRSDNQSWRPVPEPVPDWMFPKK